MKIMKDLNRVKAEYLSAGGNDPDFLFNIDSLENMYK